jgi:adenosylcobinamide amidohydrolase
MPELLRRTENGLDLPYLVWRLPAGTRVVSSGVHGGGIGLRGWILNAQVEAGYHRLDPAEHLVDLAVSAGLQPDEGVGLMTAAAVDDWCSATDGGVAVAATVGVRVPTWAAWPEDEPDPDLDPRPNQAATVRSGVTRTGTINIVAMMPVGLSDAAMVNLVATATEAKTQALLDAGVPGTGTATDVVCIAATPSPGSVPSLEPFEPFGGPRSVWGARLARAVHTAVLAGTRGSLARMGVPEIDRATGNPR